MGASGAAVIETISPPIPFVIVTSQRTGSTLLVRSLDASPSVYCAGELFHRGPAIHHPEFQYPYKLLGSRRLGDLRNLIRSTYGYRNHLKMFYRQAGIGSAAVGFKIMVSQIQRLPGILAFLKEQGVTRFYLYRKDSFAVALSYYKARVSGSFHASQGDRQQIHRSVTADEEQFRRLLGTCRHDGNVVCDLQRVYGGHLLMYEDMIANWDGVIELIGRDLGIRGLRAEKALARVGQESGSVSIANERELRLKFAVPDSM